MDGGGSGGIYHLYPNCHSGRLKVSSGPESIFAAGRDSGQMDPGSVSGVTGMADEGAGLFSRSHLIGLIYVILKINLL